jgi:hypothetical protein
MLMFSDDAESQNNERSDDALAGRVDWKANGYAPMAASLRNTSSTSSAGFSPSIPNVSA